jgi:hypothetical protein
VTILPGWRSVSLPEKQSTARTTCAGNTARVQYNCSFIVLASCASSPARPARRPRAAGPRSGLPTHPSPKHTPARQRALALVLQIEGTPREGGDEPSSTGFQGRRQTTVKSGEVQLGGSRAAIASAMCRALPAGLDELWRHATRARVDSPEDRPAAPHAERMLARGKHQLAANLHAHRTRLDCVAERQVSVKEHAGAPLGVTVGRAWTVLPHRPSSTRCARGVTNSRPRGQPQVYAVPGMLQGVLHAALAPHNNVTAHG